ncbi:MAG: tandem-95 repeat protein [Chloroflexi bacterium]|nr:tandem-95 repeat protein [Chloroflexota bacterium]
MSNGLNTSNIATVSINVTAINDAPSFSKGGDQTVLEDAGVQTVPGWATAISAGATDESSQTLSFVVSNDNNALFSVQPAVSTGGTLTYTPAPNANGSATVSVALKDNGGAGNGGSDTSATQIFTINVTPVNNLPTISDIPNQVTDEDTATAAIPFTVGDIETELLSLTLTGSSSNPVLVPNSGIVFGGSGANRTVTITPAANGFGTTTITIAVTDGDAATTSDSFVLTVNSVNDAPVAGSDVYTTDEDAPLSVAAKGVLANDADVEGSVLSAVLVSGTSHGSLTLNADGSFTYSPEPNYNGADSFTYKANDGGLDSSVATVSITVKAVNDAPVANANSYATDEDTALVIAAPGVLGNDADVDLDALTAWLVLAPSHGTVTLNPDGSFTYTPDANWNGVDSFSYKASDGSLQSAEPGMAVNITVSAVNDAPLADAQSVTTVEDTAKAITLTASDVDGDGLTYSIVSGPAHGALSGTAPNLTYTPSADYNGGDSFTFKVNDGTVDSGVATVSIQVTSVNDAPVANAGPDQTVNENTAVNLAGSGSDLDGDTITYSWLQTAGPTATLSDASSASPTFTAPDVMADTVLTFQLTVSDGGASAEDTVNIMVRNTTPTEFQAARTIGYWKNHEDHLGQTLARGSIDLGDRTVRTVRDAVAVLSNASARDARDSLRAQLLATILNLRNESDPLATGADIRPTVDSAVSFLRTHPNPVLGGNPDRQQAVSLKDRLDAYNNSGE